MKVIIAGSKNFTDYQFLEKSLDILLKNIKDNVTIISGEAKGVDKFGEFYAKKYDLDLIKFPANWNKYGKSAGPIRNSKMAEYADGLILIWNGKSRGSKNMLETAIKHNLKIKEIIYD